MQSVGKFIQGLAGAVALAAHVSVSAAPVTLQFVGALPVAWPGTSAGTAFTMTVSYDPADLEDRDASTDIAYYERKSPAQPYPFGTVHLSAGTVHLAGYVSTFFVQNGGAGQDDVVDIYGSLVDATNFGYLLHLQAAGKDWFSAPSLPLDTRFFSGASSLTTSLSESSPGLIPYAVFPVGVQVRIAAVPEPGSLALAGLALAGVTGMAAWRRRRQGTVPAYV